MCVVSCCYWKEITTIFGYVYSIIAGECVVGGFVKKVRQTTAAEDDTKGLSNAIGIIESLIFTTAFYLHQEKYIAAWISLKTAVQWQSLNPAHYELPNENNLVTPIAKIEARRKYETNGRRFLVGTGLSLLNSYVAFRSIFFLRDWDLVNFFLWPLMIVFVAYYLNSKIPLKRSN